MKLFHNFPSIPFDYLLISWVTNSGASEGRVLNKFFTIWGGSNMFYSQLGEGHIFFGKEKITPCSFYFVYTNKATRKD